MVRNDPERWNFQEIRFMKHRPIIFFISETNSEFHPMPQSILKNMHSRRCSRLYFFF